MKIFGLLLLIGLASGAPANKKDRKFLLTKEFFPKELLVYTAKYDVVNIYVPFNALNCDDDEKYDDTNDDSDTTLFFVEADIKDGVKDYKGLYLLKGSVATKLLDNGRDITATIGNTKEVYFGATDGLYTFDSENNKAIKYGSITDSIIGLAKANGSDTIYILTENKELFKVTDDGNNKEKIDDVKNAEQIVLDSSNNLYYYSADNKPYVFGVGGVIEIKGLPKNPTEVTLLKPPVGIGEDGVPFIADNKAYIIYPNGTSEVVDVEFQVKPSAYSMDATLIQYYAYEKKIYEYNFMLILLGNILNELKHFLNDKQEEIGSIASKTKLRSHAR